MGRNTFVENEWILKNIEDLSICDSFDCGDPDLNEYFHKDVKWHRTELLAKTYCFINNTAPSLILALLDFCNDAVRFKYSIPFTPDIDPRIHYGFLPAVKLTRFGVQKQFRGNNIGTHALNLVKRFFTTDNRTGCRFITVDSYNEPRIIHFYEKNGFKLFPDEDKKDKKKDTRAMYFDLKKFQNI
jgi:GNAT superfamily N-acetyltransferase